MKTFAKFNPSKAVSLLVLGIVLLVAACAPVVQADREPQETAAPVSTTSIVLPADELPAPLGQRQPQVVQVDLETVEVEARLANGASYRFWTFNGKVPGPFVRVRVGDTVEVTLKNPADSQA
ncbi:MAG TPA: multicopper oxidase domain-containing protein, partial [Anaerolineaceae bacterium]|nr:multicopper oxidase domain-containing protein [Anaerolineaceae bacterium]